MAKPRFIVGIDLGTTNSVVAYVDTRATKVDLPAIDVFSVPQVVEPGQVSPRLQLPSFLYLPNEHELPAGSLGLPWNAERKYAVGEFARRRGGQTPGRLVTSAKSWLCNPAVDRTAAILPWGAATDVPRLSPIEASARYLLHLRDAWNHAMAGEAPENQLERQQIVLTVPASFDEVARELTVEAAKEARLERVTLLEEPQAAFYCWLFRHTSDWQTRVAPDDLVLVCDIGGGTTDFSLIQVEQRADRLGFRRIAVGDHLLLGGDNMDLQLAAFIEQELMGGSGKLDLARFSVLQHACRLAKETLLADKGPAKTTVAVPGRGSSLVGATQFRELTRDEVLAKVVDGFFPITAVDEAPRRASRSAIQEFGLPYAADPAISRHLSAFLRDPTSENGHRVPRLVLFNGGVFKAHALQQRIVELLKTWFPHSPAPTVLDAPAADLDLAVAIGAAYYGLVRRGEGVRIAGGLPRSFYLGLASDQEAPSVPSCKLQALCVVPQGVEEGEEVVVPGREFDLLIREPVTFPFFSSSTRPTDRQGELLALDEISLIALPPIHTMLRSGKKTKAERVRVRLHAIVTEVGTLEIWCVAADGSRRWRLQFDIRKEAEPREDQSVASTGAEVADEEIIEPGLVDAASMVIRETFAQNPASPSPDRKAEQLTRNLEACLQRRREDWPPGALRALWPAVKEAASRRTLDPALEIRWLNLAGFLLRPGFGYPLDEWRIKDLWPNFHVGLTHAKNAHARAEWWILWRRIAGGLNKGQQAELAKRLLPVLLPNGNRRSAKSRAGNIDNEEVEMWRTAANLERLRAADRQRLGDALIDSFQSRPPKSFEAWALGRLGARVPLYGSIDTVVSREQVERWISRLLALGQPLDRDTVLALASMARRSGDRARDVDEPIRAKTIEALRAAEAKEHLIELVETGGELQQSEQSLVFGESLPPALRLIQ